MADEEAVGGDVAEHRRFGIGGLFFGRQEGGLFFCAAASRINADVAEPNILDVVARNTADDRAVFRVGVVDDDVADDHAAELSDGCRFLRASCTVAEKSAGNSSDMPRARVTAAIHTAAVDCHAPSTTAPLATAMRARVDARR